jgi:hypothetical protein
MIRLQEFSVQEFSVQEFSWPKMAVAQEHGYTNIFFMHLVTKCSEISLAAKTIKIIQQ